MEQQNTSNQWLAVAGNFTCKVVSHYYGESKEKKTPFLALELVVTESDIDHQVNKRAVWRGYPTRNKRPDGAFDNANLPEDAWDKIATRLAECFPTWDGDLVALADGNCLAGQPVDIETEVESRINPQTGEHKTTCNVKWLNSVHFTNTPGTMGQDKIDALIARSNTRTKALVKDLRAGQPQPKAATAAATTAPDDDDIPF